MVRFYPEMHVHFNTLKQLVGFNVSLRAIVSQCLLYN